MTYYINVNAKKEQDFLILLQSLKNMGILDSFESSKSLATEGAEIPSKLLLEVLEKSKSEIEEGKSFSVEEALIEVKKWKKK